MTVAVIFEAVAGRDAKTEYLDLAAGLLPLLESMDGFLSIERFESLVTPGKLLSLSFWRDEAAVAKWRAHPAHRAAQAAGRERVFLDYRLRIAEVSRDYGKDARAQAPADSRLAHS